MPPSHLIRVDSKNRLLHLQLAGFFDEAAIARFMVDRERAYRELGGRGDHVTLCDVSQCKIQSQASFERFRTLLMDRARWGAKMAFVVPTGSLAGLQVARLIAQRPGLRVFNSSIQALMWLNNAEDDRSAA